MRTPALANLQANLEFGDVTSISEDIKAAVRAYNEDDCRSASSLRDWLETQRAKLIADGRGCAPPEAGRRRTEREDHRLADQDQRADRTADSRSASRSRRMECGAASPLDYGEYR